MTLGSCRECQHVVSPDARSCPQCGAPFPYRQQWDGYGFEYKSKFKVFGVPLLHISFKYRPNRVPVVARGIIAIGQFGCGVVNISQFGVGVLSVGQFTIAGFAIAQFAAAWIAICQIGIVYEGIGQLLFRVDQLGL